MGQPAAKVVGWWRGEPSADARVGTGLMAGQVVSSVVNAPDANATVRAVPTRDASAGEPVVRLVEATPGPYVYEPLTGRSYANTASFEFGTSPRVAELADPPAKPGPKAKGQPSAKPGSLPQVMAWLEIPFGVAGGALVPGESFTVEMFVRPHDDPRRAMWAALKTRRDPKTDPQAKPGAGAFALGVRHLPQFGQSYYGASVQAGAGAPVVWSAGHYVTIARLQANNLGWRHLAMVYDAPTRTVRYYLDHWLASSQTLDAPLNLDDAALRVGGQTDPARSDGGGWSGGIDEIRLTAGALRPAEFLRACATPLANVDFRSGPGLWPADAGAICVREGFGAVGDGQTDDTDALARAFAECADKVPGAYYTVSIPAGLYRVSRMLHCGRFVMVQGAGTDRTVIRLADGAKGFGDAARPLPVLRMSSTPGDPGSHPGVNGSSIGVYLFDLTIDTGRANPGAKALEFHANNHGALERVTLRAAPGEGTIGLDLTYRCVGPALVKGLTVEGFDTGIAAKHAEYGMTLEHIALNAQRRVGILNEGNILAVRGLTTRTAAPAVVSRGAGSMVTLLDSRLTEGGPGESAITAEGGLYARNVVVGGYGQSITKRVASFDAARRAMSWADADPVTGDITEYVGDHIMVVDGGPGRSLNLPIEETPDVPRGDLATDWVNLRTFADRATDGDWSAALQAAIDSGARTVYVPPGSYRLGRTVHLRGNLVRLAGLRSRLADGRAAKSTGKPAQTPQGPPPTPGDEAPPMLIYDQPHGDHVLVIERLDLDGVLCHASAGTLVLSHTFPEGYRNAAGAGRLFGEGLMGADWRFDHPQRVWVRQWNVESHKPGPCIVSRGATIWALGFKTEYESAKLAASAGAATEILGGLIYPVVKGIPRDRPAFRNENSAMALVYGTSWYVAGHPLQVLDVQAGQTTTVMENQLRQIGPRFRMDLFVSRPRDWPGPPPAMPPLPGR